jgi:hypothetical protein
MSLTSSAGDVTKNKDLGLSWTSTRTK